MTKLPPPAFWVTPDACLAVPVKSSSQGHLPLLLSQSWGEVKGVPAGEKFVYQAVVECCMPACPGAVDIRSPLGCRAPSVVRQSSGHAANASTGQWEAAQGPPPSVTSQECAA
eukprot:629524-Rhodomonas_salina.5